MKNKGIPINNRYKYPVFALPCITPNRKNSITPAENVDPIVISATVVITKQRAKYTQLTRYNTGEANKSAKSIGSVTPVIKEVNAADNKNPTVAILLFLSGIERYIARHTAGSPIII